MSNKKNWISVKVEIFYTEIEVNVHTVHFEILVTCCYNSQRSNTALKKADFFLIFILLNHVVDGFDFEYLSYYFHAIRNNPCKTDPVYLRLVRVFIIFILYISNRIYRTMSALKELKKIFKCRNSVNWFGSFCVRLKNFNLTTRDP